MSHKAKWTGPTRIIKDLGFIIEPGDDFEIPIGLALGGEGVNFDINGGPDFDKLQAEAKDAGIKGVTKMTRLQLEQAVTNYHAAEAAAAEKAAAETEGADA